MALISDQLLVELLGVAESFMAARRKVKCSSIARVSRPGRHMLTA